LVLKSLDFDFHQKAKFIDNLLESTNIPTKYSVENAPLLGVPFSCKENIWVKDKPNSSGLVCNKNKLAPQDSEVVKNMRDAGAILIAITNLSEICLFMESRNNLYGRTNNAYNLSRFL
jgi:fatty acid amide hydrolase 2